MNNLTIQQKLIGLALFVIAALAGLGGFGLFKVAETNGYVENISTTWLPSVEVLGEISFDVAQYRLKEGVHILMSDPEGKAAMKKEIAGIRGNLTEDLARYEKGISTDEERKVYQQFSQGWDAYEKLGATLSELADQDKDAEATALYVGEMRKIFLVDIDLLNQLVKVNHDGAAHDYAASQSSYAQTRVVMFSVVGMACVIACLISYLVIASVTGGVTELTRVFTGLAALDLRMRGMSKVKDEIGKILGQFNTTAETLTAVVQGTQEAATSVAAASHELSSGMENIAQIVLQQEGSLTSIAAALEETSQSSQEVNTKAQRSGKTTLEVVNDIGRVVDKVSELKAKADSISAVLDIIRNVSEQINLLSLNATIEAARAGDSGRGFAVVAEEVKKLAGSTSASTDEISKVVADLQKSVGEASQALAAVTGSLEDVRGNSDSVVSAVGQQTIAVKNITETIEEFRHQMSLVTNNIKEAQTASLSLSAAAEQLNRQNSQFKV